MVDKERDAEEFENFVLSSNIDELVGGLEFKTTAEIEVPKRLIAGKGREIVEAYKQEAMKKAQARNFFLIMLLTFIVFYAALEGQMIWGIIAAAMLFLVARYMMPKEERNVPKLKLQLTRESKPELSTEHIKAFSTSTK